MGVHRSFRSRVDALFASRSRLCGSNSGIPTGRLLSLARCRDLRGPLLMLRGSWREIATAFGEGCVLRSSRPRVDAPFTSRCRRGRSSSGASTWDESCLWRAVQLRDIRRQCSAGGGERSSLLWKKRTSPRRLDQTLTPCSRSEEGGEVARAGSLRRTSPVCGVLSRLQRSAADAARVVTRARHYHLRRRPPQIVSNRS